MTAYPSALPVREFQIKLEAFHVIQLPLYLDTYSFIHRRKYEGTLFFYWNNENLQV